MKVLILPDAHRATLCAADILTDTITTQPDAVLGLATGATMAPLYAELIERHRAGQISFAAVTTFNLDEYVGLAPNHPCSYHKTMAEALFNQTDIRPDATHLPLGDAPDPEAEARRYEDRIIAAGGIDLQLLGIGTNGHIGFNEPPSNLASRTRVETLSAATRAANRRFFGAADGVPRYAITMGIATILDARNCVLLATGTSKAAAVAAMIEGAISAACPASALQTHPRATIILDQAAASQLRVTDPNLDLHPKGQDRVTP